VIDEDAVVEADISGTKVIIRGTVTGNVTATEKVELTLTGRLTGDVTTPDILMETGCKFIGRCLMPEKNPYL
jgi:cytoskeletal protein CcmA (bactofilin family)